LSEPGAAPPPRYGAVLFDLDGTLLDSADLIMAAFQETCRVRLGRDVDRGTILRTSSLPIRRRFQALAPDQAEELAQDYITRYLALHGRYARLFPGILDLLTALRTRGYALGIVTSKQRVTTQAALDAFHLDRWCSAVVTNEDVRRPKPDPEPVLEAARRLGVQASETLMVGDSLLDMTAGQRAGAGTAAALWGAFEPDEVLAGSPDYRLDHPADLLSLCPPA